MSTAYYGTNKWEEAINKLFEDDWQFVPDASHPHNQALGYYSMHLDRSAYGWYCKSDSYHFPRPEGDSRPRWMAAEATIRLMAMR